ncbi:hypothetical protein D3C83_96500 [compost metagenome]
MRNSNARIGNQPKYDIGDLLNVADPVMHKEDLPSAFQFDAHRVANKQLVVGMHFCCHRLPVWRSC